MCKFDNINSGDVPAYSITLQLHEVCRLQCIKPQSFLREKRKALNLPDAGQYEDVSSVHLVKDDSILDDVVAIERNVDSDITLAETVLCLPSTGVELLVDDEESSSEEQPDFSAKRLNVETDAEPYFRCGVCGQVFPHKGDLDAHKLTHGEVQRFHCESCNYYAVRASHLKRHMVHHQREKAGIGLGIQYNFRHKLAEGPTSSAVQIPVQLQSPTQSQVSGIYTSSAMQIPIQSQTPIQFLTLPQSHVAADSTFLSAVQSSFSQVPFQLQTPIQLQNLPQSQVRKLNNRAVTTPQINPHHKIGPPCQCDECGKVLKTKGSLMAHKRIHRNERRFHCEKCNYSALRNFHLIRHIVHVH